MTDEPVTVDRGEDGALAIVTLDRAERRNALTRDLKEGLVAALAEVADDPAVRAVVLTGAGSAFCVGQDLAEHAEALRADAAHAFDTVEHDYAPIIRLLATMAKPVVAGVNGTCVGAGLALALACDVRVFADDAGTMNRSLADRRGELLVVSQFTLYASTRQGNRPSWSRAAPPEIAAPQFDAFVEALAARIGKPVASGRFGAIMQVALVNDGPVTIWLDSRNRE